jgi:hypothetical protein
VRVHDLSAASCSAVVWSSVLVRAYPYSIATLLNQTFETRQPATYGVSGVDSNLCETGLRGSLGRPNRRSGARDREVAIWKV